MGFGGIRLNLTFGKGHTECSSLKQDMFVQVQRCHCLQYRVAGITGAEQDESAVDEILFDDYGAVSETFTAACDAVDSVMQSVYEQVLLEIRTDFASYGEGYTMDLTDPYTEDIFGLTEEQTELAADLADSLKLYMEEGEDDATTD